MIRKRSGSPLAEWYFRAILIDASIASAPELVKKTMSAKVVVDEALRQALPLRDAEQVRGVPELSGLLGQRRDEMRMGVAERVHRDAAAEVEISLAVARHEPGALAPLEGDVGARIGRQQRRVHGTSPKRPAWRRRAGK